MSKQLKPGDTVELKSGGPMMTVEVVYDSGDVRCVWFAGEKQQSFDFAITSLVKTED